MNSVKFLLLLAILLVASACNDNATLSSPRKADAILAISWQPAFCESHSRKKECKSQTSERFDASHFTLHGLWPQPRSRSYCNVSQKDVQRDKQGKWMQISRLELSADLRTELQRVMPGYQSGLHRHEWIKHGGCYSDTAQKYFADSLILMEKLNASTLRDLFADNVGKSITAVQIRDAMDESFGAGSGLRLRVKCRDDKNSGRRLISELTLAIAGEINASGDVGELIRSALADDKQGCPSGIVDPVGQQ
ncbi:MAG: ribonuclease [Rhizobiaceae bacterium]|nr:ribonuclease [Rhizobiaceae bacterium]